MTIIIIRLILITIHQCGKDMLIVFYEITKIIFAFLLMLRREEKRQYEIGENKFDKIIYQLNEQRLTIIIHKHLIEAQMVEYSLMWMMFEEIVKRQYEIGENGYDKMRIGLS
jgi:hypothetical protein